jgi:predicted unusual protein kinase regulating ubiquinone biosynthesis (AarF/ABC1/UbiB family)
MMMVNGFLHADPHPGNILVQDDGTLVLLDWGMVVEIPRWTREAILNVALAVGREDLDGIISGMYKLGMISPEVSRGEISEAALEIMRILERAQTTSQERVQELVQQLFDTFYTWPIMLPQELVYFFRAGMLLEGVGFRYDPQFNGLQFMKGVIRRFQGDILRTTGKEPAALARNFMDEAQGTLRSLRELVARAEREELRVRVHPQDMQGQERFLLLQARRVLLSVFATATALITSILFISIRSWWLLGTGFLTSLAMFVLVFFLPSHLLENPLRHARGIRPNDPWK